MPQEYSSAEEEESITSSSEQRKTLKSLIILLEKKTGQEVITQEEYDNIKEGTPDSVLESYIDKLKSGYQDYDIDGHFKKRGFPRRKYGAFGYGLLKTVRE